MRKQTDNICREDLVSLKEYFESKIQGLDEATDLAREEMNRRLGEMNQFRDQLRDQAGTFLTKDTYESKHEILVTRIESLEKAMAENKGKEVGISTGWRFLIAVVGLFSTLALLLNAYRLFLEGK